MNERGQGMSISTVILLILGLVILVVLILGFALGWNKVAPFISSSNLNSLSTQCSAACTTNSYYDFCSNQFDLNTGTITLSNVTCYYVAAEAPQDGIASCPSVTSSNPSCTNITFVTTNANSGPLNTLADIISNCQNYKGKLVEGLVKNTLQSANC